VYVLSNIECLKNKNYILFILDYDTWKSDTHRLFLK